MITTMNTTMINTTNQSIAEWEETIALTLIVAWSLGLIAFMNAFGNHHRAEQWYPVGQYQVSSSAKPTTLYEGRASNGEVVWRYKTAQSTWSYPRASAVRRRAHGLDLWFSEESSMF
jgi:hypothetical protein